MRRALVLKAAFVCAAALVLLPAVASAQSAIAGVVRDETGGVMPGVTVEVTSPALIEKTRSVETDSAGQYKILDLRPGTYTVSFILQGFNTIRREGIELAANFTAPVNAELKVGSVEETLTVSGQSPVVDLQSTARRDSLARDLIDQLPTGRNFQTAGSLLPSVSMGKFDVGGSTAMQTGNTLSAAGSRTGDTTEEVDGMQINSALGSSSNVPVYMNDAVYEEQVYTLVGGTADVQTPGVKINLIPKSGGNEFHGSGAALFANTDFQAKNISDAEIARQGVQSAPRLDKLWDYSATLGGRIIRDRLWFYTGFRHWGYNNFAPNALLPDGSQAVDDNSLQAINNRLTAQINSQNKITAMYDKFPKWRGHRNIENGTYEPSATYIQLVPLAYNAQAKWTSTMTNKLLIEAGWSTNFYNYWLNYQDGLLPSATNPLGVVSQVNADNNRTYSAARYMQDSFFNRHYIVSSATYVSGSHAIKIGEQHSWGWVDELRIANGDLYEEYRGVPGAGGTPFRVNAYNSPTRKKDVLEADLGVYAQDTWTMKRLTLNPGVRFDYMKQSNAASDAPAGRFAPARHFDERKYPGWATWSPRLGAVYDLFGTGKTAIKGSFGKYMQRDSVSFAGKYNPMTLSSDQRTWSGARDALGNPINLGPSSNARFGLAADVNPDPNIKRPYQLVFNIGVTQELWPRTAITANWYRREYHDITATRNTVVPLTAFTPINVPDPRPNRPPITIYNLTGAPLGDLNQHLEDYTSPNNTQTYNGYDVTVASRLPNGGSVSGGISIGHTISVTCDVADANSLRFCDESEFDIPWYPVYKVNGAYPLPYGFRVSGVLMAEITTQNVNNTYLINRTIVPSLVQTSVNPRLDPPGTFSLPRDILFNMGFSRTFTFQKIKLLPTLDIFNVFNSNNVQSRVTAFGPNGRLLDTGEFVGNSNTNMTGRLARLQMQVQF